MIQNGLSRYGRRFALIALILIVAGLTAWASAQQRASILPDSYVGRQTVDSTVKEFGWEIDREQQFCFVVQLSPSEAAAMQEGAMEFPCAIPIELKGRLDRIVVRIGSNKLRREPALTELTGIEKSELRKDSFKPADLPPFPVTSNQPSEALAEVPKVKEDLKSPEGKLDAAGVQELYLRLSESFDRRHEEQEAELTKMATRVEALKKDLELREASKKEIIEMRIKEICDEYHPLSWDYQLDFSESIGFDSTAAPPPSTSNTIPPTIEAQ